MLKKTKKFGIGKFLVMALVLGGGLVYGTQLVQKNQENRSSAASKGTYVKKCSSGQRKCNGNLLLICNNKGSWINSRVCPEGCKDGNCLTKTPSCTSGKKECRGNSIVACINGSWSSSVVCPEGCKDGNCLSSISTCTSVIYSNWSPCINGKQTRTVFEKNPSGCTVDNPVLSQSCSNL